MTADLATIADDRHAAKVARCAAFTFEVVAEGAWDPETGLSLTGFDLDAGTAHRGFNEA